METGRDLAAMFTVLLFGVVWPAGCKRGYGYGGQCTSTYVRPVDAEALALALQDMKLSFSECEALCEPPRRDPGTPTTGSDSCDPSIFTGTDTTAGTSSVTTGTGTDASTSTDASTTTTSTGTTSTDASTGTAGTDASTGTAGTDASTGTAGTDASTGTTGLYTGTTASTDTTAGDTSAGSPACATAPATTDEDQDYNGDLHDCAPIAGRTAVLHCSYADCVYGRRPQGLRSDGRAAGPDPLGRWFAEAAHLEAASVPAFERLAAALAGHGAPASLRQRALRAADDERRHTIAMTTLAAALGDTPAAPVLDEASHPSLLELARDNAAQGCVGETWAALLARHQADVADTPRVREVMAEIAADETEHAELAWAIDAWLRTRLSPPEQAEVAAARRAACASLREQLLRADDHPALLAVGVPRRSTALALHDGLTRALWRAA